MMPARDINGGEHAVTLVELVVVMGIVLILGAALAVSLSGESQRARNKQLATSVGTIDIAVSDFNRMFPSVQSDHLVTRGGGTFDQDDTESTGLYSKTGDKLLAPWPEDPWTGEPITIRVYDASGCPDSGSRGDVHVCRITDASPAAYQIRAYGSHGQDAPVVYDKTHGPG